MIILDRIEENIAILTGTAGRVYEVPKDLLPDGSKENDSFEAVFVGNNIIDLVPGNMNTEAVASGVRTINNN